MHNQNDVKKMMLWYQIQFPEITIGDNTNISAPACSTVKIFTVFLGVDPPPF